MKEEQLRELLEDMSVEEKIGQMVQLTGAFYAQEGLATGPIQAMKLTEQQVQLAGSVLSTVGAAKLRKLQTEYMEKQPHHIPLMFMADVINGFRTVFPIPLALGCSFDPEIMRKTSEISAREMARAGVHVTFSPMVDLVRDARWGRVMESTGEDSYLNRLFAEAAITGYQGEGVGTKDHVVACMKHFAGYGAPVGGREYNQVELSERTLWEEYLPGYRAGVDAGAKMVMTAFHTLGRIPCTANKELIQGVLREQWGYDGVLISDWAAIRELLEHGVAEDEAKAADLAMQSGVDIDMMTNIYALQLKKLVEAGKITMEQLDTAVYRILRLKNELGLFENPYKDAEEAYDEREQIDPAHTAYARKILPDTFVLLKNEEGILPLSKKPEESCRSIAFIGPFMKETEVCGAWSFFNRKEENVTLEQALEEQELTVPYTVEEGCHTLPFGMEFAGIRGRAANPYGKEELEKLKERAVASAKKADVVVMALGEHSYFSGEGGSRTQITIPEHQLELFRAVTAVHSRVVVVTFSGRPLDLREIHEKAQAILHVWFPGTEAGHAVMDVLFGASSPGGRLSMSFPYCVGQVPISYNELSTGRQYLDGTEANRFFSRYIDAPNHPLFVFGYGLDYTEYQYDRLVLHGTQVTKEHPLEVSVDVTNIGKREGKEVVQMYLQDLAGSVARPVRELKGFQKLSLAPQETQTVTFTITEEMLRFYDKNMNYGSEPGEYKVYIGGSSDARLSGSFRLV